MVQMKSFYQVIIPLALENEPLAVVDSRHEADEAYRVVVVVSQRHAHGVIHSDKALPAALVGSCGVKVGMERQGDFARVAQVFDRPFPLDGVRSDTQTATVLQGDYNITCQIKHIAI